MHTNKLNKSLIVILAIASGVTVANIYYIQPLLNEFSKYFSITSSQSGILATLTQIGYAAGLFFILPAADIINRKKLLLSILFFSIISLFLFTLSPNFTVAVIISFTIGLTSIVPQLLIPFGAQMSEPQDRGKNIGTIMSGLLIGMLASRVFSGLIGNNFGWKSVYLCATVLVGIIFILLYKMLPKNNQVQSITYINSLKSLFTLPKKYKVLAQSSVIGAVIFAIFSAFWSVLTFYLSNKFKFSSDIIGLFGVLGISGAIFAPLAGKMSDKKGTSFTILFHLVIIAVLIIILKIFENNIVGIVIGIILLDYGVQCCNVANQARIQSLSNSERNRITSIYMVSFFLGGSCGTYIGTNLYDLFSWNGFIIMSTVLILFALIFHICTIFYAKKKTKK